MPFNQLTLSDLTDVFKGDISSHATTVQGLQYNSDYIDMEVDDVTKAQTINSQMLYLQSDGYIFSIDDITDKSLNITPNMIPIIANVNQIFISTIYKYKRVTDTSRDNINEGLIELINSILSASATFKNSTSLIFDNIITTYAYDLFAYKILKHVIEANVKLNVLSIPASLLLMVLEEDESLIDKLIILLRRGKIQELSINEVYMERVTKYQKDYFSDLTTESTLKERYIDTLIKLFKDENIHADILFQSIPSDINLARCINYDGCPVSSETSSTGLEYAIPKLTKLVHITKHLIEKNTVDDPNRYLLGFKSLSNATRNLHLFCNLKDVEHIIKCPLILTKCNIVIQLDSTNCNDVYNFNTYCIDYIQDTLKRSLCLQQEEKTYFLRISTAAIEGIQFNNLYYLFVRPSNEKIQFIDRDNSTKILTNESSNLGVIQLGSFSDSGMPTFNYFF